MPLRNHRLTAEEYGQHFSDIHPPFETHNAALVEANRCLYCYDAPCTKSCPTSIDVPKFIKQLTTENVKGAAYTILSANIFGAGCSRVCPVEKLCEGACVYNLMEEEAIPIARLQRYATERVIREKWSLFDRKPSTGKRVAIIGAGPAGLTCAHALAREGVEVTIYEKESKAGGLMTYGIAAYKVTPAFCQEEVDYILSLGGINIIYEQEIAHIEALDHDAVFLAFGVGLARQLNIPGEELNGVVDAINFIYDIRTNDFSAVPVGDKVAVIGMGMTAIDAATQAKRLGAKEVTLVYRRTQQEMSCTVTELNIAKLDGCNIVWMAAPRKMKGEDGQVTHLICDVMSPDFVKTGKEISIPVDMVIKATGQMRFEELDRLVREKRPGVFAGGDCVNGGKEVVDAVQSGKDGAAAILNYLFKTD